MQRVTIFYQNHACGLVYQKQTTNANTDVNTDLDAKRLEVEELFLDETANMLYVALPEHYVVLCC